MHEECGYGRREWQSPFSVDHAVHVRASDVVPCRDVACLPCGTLSQALAILKDDSVREPAKHKGCERILGALTGANFNRLVNLGKAIVDFATGDGDKVCARACGVFLVVSLKQGSLLLFLETGG